MHGRDVSIIILVHNYASDQELNREGLELGLGDDRDRVGTWFPKKGVG